MSKKPAVAKAMDIEEFLRERTRKSPNLPNEAIEDIRYFAKRAKEGAVISQRGVTEWILKNYGLEVGRTRLFNATKAAGIEPWWTK